MGEIELCLVWEDVSAGCILIFHEKLTARQASSRHPSIGEWWCSPDTPDNPNTDTIELVLTDTDRAIDNWYEKWRVYIEHGT
jgi:hypothetical protein